MFNVMTPDHHAAILAKFGLHGPRKQMGGLGAFGGGTSPTDPHGGTGTPPADGGGTATYQPVPNPGMPHLGGHPTPQMGGLMAGMLGNAGPSSGSPVTSGQPMPVDPHGGAMGAGGPMADPRTGVPAAGPNAAYGQPQGNFQSLLTAGQAPATGQLPPWLQNLLALMR